MQKFRWLIQFAACVVLTGCFFASQHKATESVKTRIGTCVPFPCVSVDIAALPKLPPTVADAAQKTIEQEVRRVLYAPLDVDNNEYTQASVIRELNARLDDYESVGDAHIDWTLTRTATVLFSDKRVTACEVTNVGYLGGAHGFKERTLMTFHSQTGQRLAATDVVSEQSQQMFRKIVEAEFRRARSVRFGQTLQDAGFFILPGQELPLGENFALTNSGLEIQYNPYEVAPYSMGETRVRVPHEAIEPLVREDLRAVFSDANHARIDG